MVLQSPVKGALEGFPKGLKFAIGPKPRFRMTVGLGHLEPSKLG